MLEETPVRIRVIYADTDATGIVYHTNSIRWSEMERNELFRDMCILYAEIEAAGCGLPLTQVYCHYLLSASYDDVILVYTRIGYLKRVSMEFTYEIWDEQRQNILAEGYTIHACTDKSGKITRIPPMIADKVRPILSHYLRS